MKRVDLAIIGAGSIGSALTGHIIGCCRDKVRSLNVYDIDEAKMNALAAKDSMVFARGSMEEAVSSSQLVIEAAGKDLAGELLLLALEERKDLMLMSIGGLLGEEHLTERMEKEGLKLLLPSGAIAGIDAIKASRIAGIDDIEITTHKSPDSVAGAPYLEENNIDIASIKHEQVLFEGTAAEVIKWFPENINVSVLLSMAGVGLEETRVRIIVSPEFKTNTHKVRVRSSAGQVTTVTENLPSPLNPKTSYLAALSAMASLDEYLSAKRIGS